MLTDFSRTRCLCFLLADLARRLWGSKGLTSTTQRDGREGTTWGGTTPNPPSPGPGVKTLGYIVTGPILLSSRPPLTGSKPSRLLITTCLLVKHQDIFFELSTRLLLFLAFVICQEHKLFGVAWLSFVNRCYEYQPTSLLSKYNSIILLKIVLK